jgi:glycosyltransferase involved in cell wall biosynthesis
MGSLSEKKTSPKHVWRSGYKSALEILKPIIPQPFLEIKSKIIKWRESKTIQQNQEILRQILQEKRPGKDYRAVIVFPPSLDWNLQLFQRPQQLALALAKQGALVFYIEPQPDHQQQPFKLFRERLYLCPVHVDTFQIIQNPIVYTLTWNSRFCSQFIHPVILYDYLDDINTFYGNHRKIAKSHQYLLQNASYVLVTARILLDEVRPLRDDIIFSPNAVDYEHFTRAAQHEFSVPPQDMQAVVSTSDPIIGYYGALARWFDYELLYAVAGLRPGYQFVLIGPDYDGTMDSARVRKMTNVHWLGVKSYEELPHYLQYFDVAMIPFIINNITHATSPLKLFEYMAGEKPIVITPMQESMQYPGVLVGKDAVEFARQLDLALQKREDQKYLSLLRQTAMENTWSQRAEEILLAVEKHANA